ncbi:MAG: MMPL family transporter [Hyphomicrobiaceae bacterium]|nr:MMPL family transporter [Hyphomicrobiaceae bacterium]
MSKSDVHVSRFRFALGLDRLGLIALKAPRLTALIIIALTGLAVLGVLRLSVDDSLSELFKTDTEEFRRYELVSERFPSSEFDVLVVVEGPDLLKPQPLTTFRNMVEELALTEGVKGVVSLFSARGKPDVDGRVPPLVPDTMPNGPAYDQMLKALRENDIVKGKFLSDDAELALVVLALDARTVKDKGLATVIGLVQQAATQGLSGSGLTAKLTGAPVMQLEIRNAVNRDRLVYNGLGFLCGLIVAFLFFRRLSLTLIAVLGPSIAVLWTLGVIGSLDYRLNLFINVITPLIMVSGFSDSMHLVTAIRREIMEGVDRIAAARNAVIDVAPACLLTAMNAALALVSFAFAKSALVRTFGIAALIAVAISYIAVAVVVPTLAALLVRREPPHKEGGERRDAGMVAIGRLTQAIVAHVIRSPAVYAIAGVLIVVAAGLAYANLKPHYRLADQVPDKEQALAATDRLDKKLTGANPVHVMVEWPADKTLYSEEILKLIGEVHAIVEQRAGLGNVWSLESLRRWLKEAGDERIATIKQYVGLLPTHLKTRFINEPARSVLVTGRLPDVDASQILPVVEMLDRALDALRQQYPAATVSVTGLPAIAARNSARLIGELNVGLVGDMFVIFIFLGLALRSVMSGVASILPSLFPIFATGALLYVTGEGLQFASIIAITVAFALAIDSTIHFLNRFNLEELAVGPGPESARQALMRTIEHIGPAVVLTTIVLALGLGVTILSHLPSLRLFGRLTAITLGAALVAQLIILPATIALWRHYWPLKAERQPEPAKVT